MNIELKRRRVDYRELRSLHRRHNKHFHVTRTQCFSIYYRSKMTGKARRVTHIQIPGINFRTLYTSGKNIERKANTSDKFIEI